MSLARRSSLVALMFTAAGCATISTGVDPDARRAGVTSGAEVHLAGNWEGVDIYVDGAQKPATVVYLTRYTFGQALGNELRRVSAEQAAKGQSRTMLGAPVKYSWKEYSSIKPAIYLSQGREHTLRIVRADGSESSTTLKPHVGMKYVFLDWCCTMLTGVLVDASTKKWKVYDEFDVSSTVPGSPGAQEADRMTPYAAHVAQAEEAFRQKHGRYASEKEIILAIVDAQFAAKLIPVAPSGYAAFVGRNVSSRKGKACVFYAGDVGDKIPFTPKQRRKPAQPLQLACDD